MTNLSNTRTNKIQRRYNRYSYFYDFFESPMEIFFGKYRKKLISQAVGDILEVGVGTGNNLKYYSSSQDVIAIDFSEGMLSKAIRKNTNNVKLSLMDVEKLEFPAESFDTVITTFVFCSVPHPIEGLKEIKRVLKPDGKLLMLEHVGSKKFPFNKLMNLLNPITVFFFGYNINRDTSQNIIKAGLEIEKEENLFMDILKMYKVRKLRE